jgi:hypothetical protein
MRITTRQCRGHFLWIGLVAEFLFICFLYVDDTHSLLRLSLYQPKDLRVGTRAWSLDVYWATTGTARTAPCSIFIGELSRYNIFVLV